MWPQQQMKEQVFTFYLRPPETQCDTGESQQSRMKIEIGFLLDTNLFPNPTQL